MDAVSGGSAKCLFAAFGVSQGRSDVSSQTWETTNIRTSDFFFC